MEASKNTIVIVGAGPVGLWVSCQLKLLNSEMKVVIFEKRETYVREHTLKLKKSYMSTPSIKDKRFEEIKNKIDGKTPTNILESELKKFAEELNVQIYKGETIEKLEDVYKRVDPNNILALLGCDGRRSTVRTKIMEKHKQGDKLDAYKSIWNPIMHPFNIKNRWWAHSILKSNPQIDEENNTIEETTFLHQLMLKYTILEKGKQLSPMHYYKTLKLLSYSATEIVGKYNEEKKQTEATCIFILNPDIVPSVKKFVPYHPGKFNQLEGEVKNSVDCWMNAKQELVGQKIKPDSERLVYVPISVYSACSFIDQSKLFPIALVGDAAYGVPYFKALNTGLQCGTLIAELLSECFSSKKKSDKFTKEQFNKYQSFMGNKVYELFARSKMKSESYDVAIKLFKKNSKLPWQFIKWSDGDFKKKLFKTFDPTHEENDNFTSIDVLNNLINFHS